MRKRMIHRKLPLLAAVTFAATSPLSAQQIPDPPKLLRIFREHVKEGRRAAHQKTEIRYAQAMARAKYPANYFALVSMTGPSEVWFMEAQDSFASLAETEAFSDKPALQAEMDTLDAQDAEFRSGSSTWIMAYRGDLSYRVAELTKGLPKTRYFNVIVFHVHQNRDTEFAELGKTANAALEKGGVAQPSMVYQVISGAASGTYVLFEPMTSLKALDDAPARGRAMFEAMGESGMKRFENAASEIIAGSEPRLFVINPKMSYVPSHFASGDPEFWAPKPPAAKTPAK